MARPSTSILVLDTVLPGSGLILAGYIGWGIALLAPTSVEIALGLLTLMVWPNPLPVLLILGGVHLLLAGIAHGKHWWQDRRSRLDPTRVRDLHRRSCAAYLNGKSAEALALAQDLVRAAPEESGAWRFLAMVAGDHGDSRLAVRASKRAQAIEDR